MSSSATEHHTDNKRRAALWSLLITVLLVFTKAAIGLLTGSLGILADAAQSASDLLLSTLTFVAVIVSARPPDFDHPYGHGKVENLSAFFEAGLLLLTCGWITYEAVHRLIVPVPVDVNVWALGIMLLSMIVNWVRARGLRQVARQTNSQALEADALNFESDIWLSGTVILGLLAMFAGETLGIPFLDRADSVAALAVAAFIAYLSIKLLRETVDVLMDRAHEPLADAIRADLETMEDVLNVVRVRTRRGGPITFVDIVVTADRQAQFLEAHKLTEEIERAVRNHVANADVVVSIVPEATPDETIASQVMFLARQHGARAHDIALRELERGLEVDFHLEVPAELTLAEAHGQSQQIETELRQLNPSLYTANIHIEAPHEDRRRQRDVTREQTELARRITNVAESVTGPGSCRQVRLYRTGEGSGFDAVLLLALPGNAPVDAVHDRTEDVEKALRLSVSSLRSVLIHAEPRQV